MKCNTRDEAFFLPTLRGSGAKGVPSSTCPQAPSWTPNGTAKTQKFPVPSVPKGVFCSCALACASNLLPPPRRVGFLCPRAPAQTLGTPGQGQHYLKRKPAKGGTVPIYDQIQPNHIWALKLPSYEPIENAKKKGFSVLTHGTQQMGKIQKKLACHFL